LVHGRSYIQRWTAQSEARRRGAAARIARNPAPEIHEIDDWLIDANQSGAPPGAAFMLE
jgi:hypothetical protein